MTETYIAEVVLESNGNKVRIVASANTIANWPERIVESLLETLKGQLEGFVVTHKEVKQ